MGTPGDVQGWNRRSLMGQECEGTGASGGTWGDQRGTGAWGRRRGYLGEDMRKFSLLSKR